MNHKLLFRVLCCLTVLCLACGFTAFAAESSGAATGSIRFELSVDGTPMKTGSLLVIEVARCDENGDYVWTDAFAGCGLSFDDLSDKAGVQKLADYASDYNGSSWTVLADGSGYAIMEQVELGLYLVLPKEPFDDCYEVIPFVLSVPSWESGEVIYDIVSIPKLSVVPSPPPPEEPPEIPKTGQLNWPIPLLFTGGALLILLGVLLWTRKNYEA